MSLPASPGLQGPQPTDWSQWAALNLPQRLASWGLASQLVGLTLLATENVAFEAFTESVLQRCQQLSIFSEDALPVLSLEAGLPQYPVESNAAFIERLNDKWSIWSQAGQPQAIVSQLAGAGIPYAYLLYDLPPCGGYSSLGIPSYPSTASGWWSQFALVIPLFSGSIGTGAQSVPGSTPSALLSQGQLDTVRQVVTKFKAANWACRQVIVQDVVSGSAPLYDDERGYHYDTSGITYGSGSFVAGVERFAANNAYTKVGRTVAY